MSQFPYHEQVLFCEQVPVPLLAATYGTPLFVYSASAIVDVWSQPVCTVTV